MPQDAGAGGYHWQSKSHVIGWDEGKAAMAEEREVGFAALLDDLPADPDTPLRVVDLGAGDGKVAEVVLERFPQASAALVDLHGDGDVTLPEMAALARLEHHGPTTTAALARHDQVSPAVDGNYDCPVGATWDRRARSRPDRWTTSPDIDQRARTQVCPKASNLSVDGMTKALRRDFTVAELRRLAAAVPLIERLAQTL